MDRGTVQAQILLDFTENKDLNKESVRKWPYSATLFLLSLRLHIRSPSSHSRKHRGAKRLLLVQSRDEAASLAI